MAEMGQLNETMPLVWSKFLSRRRPARGASANRRMGKWRGRQRVTSPSRPAVAKQPGFGNMSIQVGRQVAVLAGNGVESQSTDTAGLPPKSSHLGGLERASEASRMDRGSP